MYALIEALGVCIVIGVYIATGIGAALVNAPMSGRLYCAGDMNRAFDTPKEI